MPGLFPNPSAAPEAFNIGEAVRYYVNEREISPYLGVVTSICPGIQKVWVEWSVGGNRQMSPEELIKVPPFQGTPAIYEESGYSSYDKEKSKKDYGTIKNEKVVKLSNSVVNKIISKESNEIKVNELATKVASTYAANVIDKLTNDIVDSKKKDLLDIQAYQEIYPKYSSVCSDHIIRYSISEIYNKAE